MLSAPCRSSCPGRPKCIETASRSATREVTYSDLWERTGNLAGNLQNEGVRHDDTVVLLMSNGVALVESYLAVTRAGVVGVCLSPQVTSEDIHFFHKDVSPSAVIIQ